MLAVAQGKLIQCLLLPTCTSGRESQPGWVCCCVLCHWLYCTRRSYQLDQAPFMHMSGTGWGAGGHGAAGGPMPVRAATAANFLSAQIVVPSHRLLARPP